MISGRHVGSTKNIVLINLTRHGARDNSLLLGYDWPNDQCLDSRFVHYLEI